MGLGAFSNIGTPIPISGILRNFPSTAIESNYHTRLPLRRGRLLVQELNMPFRPALLLLFLSAALLPCSLVAESTDCTTPVIIIPDGRLTPSSFAANTAYWYGIYTQARHSYSVEFEPPADNFASTNRPRFAPIMVFASTDTLQACRGTSTVAVTQNSGYAPVIFANSNGAGRRVSFTAQTSGLHLIQVTNTMGAGSYTFRAVDTSLISVRWNTAPGYDILWVMMNMSDMPLTGTLTVLDMNGQVVTAVPVSIAPGGRVARTSAASDINVPRNMAGSALFSHNGPPNSIMAEGFIIGPTSTLLEKFESIASR